MAKKNITDLKALFASGKFPVGADFVDLIDSTMEDIEISSSLPNNSNFTDHEAQWIVITPDKLNGHGDIYRRIQFLDTSAGSMSDWELMGSTVGAKGDKGDQGIQGVPGDNDPAFLGLLSSGVDYGVIIQPATFTTTITWSVGRALSFDNSDPENKDFTRIDLAVPKTFVITDLVSSSQFFYMDKNEVIISLPAQDFTLKNKGYIEMGAAGVFGGVVVQTVDLTVMINSPIANMHDMHIEQGLIRKGGEVVIVAESLNLSQNSGHLAALSINRMNDPENPNRLAIPEVEAASWVPSTPTNIQGTPVNTINPNSFLLAGVPTAVPVDEWSLQRIYRGKAGALYIFPGMENTYETEDAALDALSRGTFEFTNHEILSERGNAIHLGDLVVQQGVTNLNSARIIDGDVFGLGSSGGGGAGGSFLNKIITSPQNFAGGVTWAAGQTYQAGVDITGALASGLNIKLPSVAYVGNGANPGVGTRLTFDSNFHATDSNGNDIHSTTNDWNYTANSGSHRFSGGEMILLDDGLDIRQPLLSGAAMVIPDNSWIMPQTVQQGLYLTNGANPSTQNSTLHLENGISRFTAGDGSFELGSLVMDSSSVELRRFIAGVGKDYLTLDNEGLSLQSATGRGLYLTSNDLEISNTTSNISLNTSGIRFNGLNGGYEFINVPEATATYIYGEDAFGDMAKSNSLDLAGGATFGGAVNGTTWTSNSLLAFNNLMTWKKDGLNNWKLGSANGSTDLRLFRYDALGAGIDETIVIRTLTGLVEIRNSLDVSDNILQGSVVDDLESGGQFESIRMDGLTKLGRYTTGAKNALNLGTLDGGTVLFDINTGKMTYWDGGAWRV